MLCHTVKSIRDPGQPWLQATSTSSYHLYLNLGRIHSKSPVYSVPLRRLEQTSPSHIPRSPVALQPSCHQLSRGIRRRLDTDSCGQPSQPWTRALDKRTLPPQQLHSHVSVAKRFGSRGSDSDQQDSTRWRLRLFLVDCGNPHPSARARARAFLESSRERAGEKKSNLVCKGGGHPADIPRQFPAKQLLLSPPPPPLGNCCSGRPSFCLSFLRQLPTSLHFPFETC